MNVNLTMAALAIACLAVAGCGGSASSSTPAGDRRAAPGSGAGDLRRPTRRSARAVGLSTARSSDRSIAHAAGQGASSADRSLPGVGHGAVMDNPADPARRGRARLGGRTSPVRRTEAGGRTADGRGIPCRQCPSS